MFTKALADSLLRDTYLNLPKLPGCVTLIIRTDSLLNFYSGKTNVSWKESSDTSGDSAPDGMMRLSIVKKIMPALDIESVYLICMIEQVILSFSYSYIKSLITFSHDKSTNVINLSRVDPTMLIYKKSMAASASSTYKSVYIRDQRDPALCYALICVDEDYTKAVKSNGGPYESKIVTGTPLSLEYERKVALLCLVMDNVPFIRTQISDNRWTFSTRPAKAKQEGAHF